LLVQSKHDQYRCKLCVSSQGCKRMSGGGGP
jgi:hypothetical protein